MLTRLGAHHVASFFSGRTPNAARASHLLLRSHIISFPSMLCTELYSQIARSSHHFACAEAVLQRTKPNPNDFLVGASKYAQHDRTSSLSCASYYSTAVLARNSTAFNTITYPWQIVPCDRYDAVVEHSSQTHASFALYTYVPDLITCVAPDSPTVSRRVLDVKSSYTYMASQVSHLLSLTSAFPDA